MDKAIDLIVQCLGDSAIKVCMGCMDSPACMWKKLEEAYSDTSGNTKRFLWDNTAARNFQAARNP